MCFGEGIMQLLVLILKRTELAGELMIELAEAGIHGGTMLDSTGMGSVLGDLEDMPMFSLLRSMLDHDGHKQASKTMLFVLEDSEIDKARKVIQKVVGDLSVANSAVMFGLPVTFVEGLGEKKWS